jgi:hypothetical protein
MGATAMIAAIDLPVRAGTRPRATTSLPHTQLDQQPDDARQLEAILTEAATWSYLRLQASGIAPEGARALVLTADAETGPADAFLVGREFCHAHAGGDFSLHAALPVTMAAAAQQAGWAEPHYLVASGQAPPTVVMLYAPRDESERDVILRLVRISYAYALGDARLDH